jgi:hypothetical protein
MQFGIHKFAVLAVMVAGANSFALEAGSLKKHCDKAANYIIEQFDNSTNQYKGVKPDDTVTQAVIVASLADHARKYREGHGPWMSVPTAAVAKATDATGASRDFTLIALQASQNDKYKPLIEALKAKGPLPTGTIAKAEELAPKAATNEVLTDLFWKTRKLFESKTREVEIDGAKVKWAEVLGENLVKLQKDNGSFADDLKANALASLLLTHCYLTLK